MERGLPTRSRWTRESYDEIAKLIHPEAIVEKLRVRDGTELDSPDYYVSERDGIERQVSDQFVVCHQRAHQERDDVSDSPVTSDEDEAAVDEQEYVTYTVKAPSTPRTSGPTCLSGYGPGWASSWVFPSLGAAWRPARGKSSKGP